MIRYSPNGTPRRKASSQSDDTRASSVSRSFDRGRDDQLARLVHRRMGVGRAVVGPGPDRSRSREVGRDPARNHSLERDPRRLENLARLENLRSQGVSPGQGIRPRVSGDAVLLRTVSGPVAFCLASGNSLTSEDCETVRAWRDADPDRRIVVVTNNTVFNCPWADVLVAMDKKWWTVYEDDVKKTFKGLSFAAHAHGKIPSVAPFKLFGNTGASAISAAAHFGAREIYLLGYDCQITNNKTHHHGSHQHGLSDALSMVHWPSHFKSVQAHFRDRKIVNVTRQTALKVFPTAVLEDVL